MFDYNQRAATREYRNGYECIKWGKQTETYKEKERKEEMKNIFGDELCKICGSAVKGSKCTYPECKSHKKTSKGGKK